MNHKLFNLGNDVVRISKEIDRLKCSGYVSIPSIPMMLLMEDILNIVNIIRMETMREEKYKLIIDCSIEKLNGLLNILNDNFINYELERVSED